MGTGKSNVYSLATGATEKVIRSKTSPNSERPKNRRCSRKVLRHKTLDYAKQMEEKMKTRKDLNSRQRDSMNTVCVAFDAHSGHYFYGRNQGIWQDNPPRNKYLFGDGDKPGILPQK